LSQLAFGGACITAIVLSMLASATHLVAPSRLTTSTIEGAVVPAAVFSVLIALGGPLWTWSLWQEGWLSVWTSDRRSGMWLTAAFLYILLASATRASRFQRFVPALVLLAPLLPILVYEVMPPPCTLGARPPPISAASLFLPAFLCGVPIAAIVIFLRSRAAFLSAKLTGLAVAARPS
jgi:hypothetical protein